MTDILIPLMKDGSKHDNFELRICLRSIEKHLKDYGNIYIIGEKPGWLTGAIHIPFEDSTDNKQRAWNIYSKLTAGINYISDIETKYIDKNYNPTYEQLSDNFLFMNDDHYLLTDYIAGEFPYYHRGPIQTHRVGNEAQRIQMENTVNDWRLKRMDNTKVLLYKQVNSILDYDVHCPVVYNKFLFSECFKGLEWPDYGYGIKSLYCNNQLYVHFQSQQCEDLKFTEKAMKESIYRALEGRGWWSIGDKCLTGGGMIEVLNELYPLKSKYEL